MQLFNLCHTLYEKQNSQSYKVLQFKKRIPSELVVPFEQTEGISDITPSAEESFISQSEAEYISSIISFNLTKQEKEIFMLYLTGMSYEEIARIAGITPKAVDGTLQRARKKLREKLSL